jgi:plastocyanin
MSRAHRVVATVFILLGVSACGQPEPAAALPPQTGGALLVTVPQADRFAPPVMDVKRGSSVTFRNADTDAHTVTSVPGDPTTFNITIAAGRSAVLTFDRVGIYRYFCALHARYDSSTDEVAGLPTADRPSEPMQGVIVVS